MQVLDQIARAQIVVLILDAVFSDDDGQVVAVGPAQPLNMPSGLLARKPVSESSAPEG